MLNKRFYMKVTQRSLAEITMALKNSSPDAINTFFLKYPAPQYNHADFRSMSSSELYGLSEFTCSTIGVHTVNHPRLTILDEQGIFEELRVSKHTIEKTVGAKVSVCSFPFGAYDPRVLKACNQLGFEKAATTSGRNAYHWQHALKIPRINVENTGIDEFRRTIDKHLLGYR